MADPPHLGLLATAFGNLIPLYGVLFWGWDTFQLLMLYWAETVVLFFWTMWRVAMLPPELLGRIAVNGVDRPFTPVMAVGFFSLHSTGFIAAHCFALWMLFSGPWLEQYHPGGVVAELFTTNGAWIALLFLFVASWISFLLDVRPAYVARVGALAASGAWLLRLARRCSTMSAPRSACSTCASSLCMQRWSSA